MDEIRQATQAEKKIAPEPDSPHSKLDYPPSIARFQEQ
jgi:hypothetical protein